MAFLQVVRRRPQTARGMCTFPFPVISSHGRSGVTTGLRLSRSIVLQVVLTKRLDAFHLLLYTFYRRVICLLYI